MLIMDIGGSFIKYALTDEKGCLLPGSEGMVPSCAEGTYEEVLEALKEILSRSEAMQQLKEACISIAGPFDFENGISLMKHKFPALYGKSLRTPFEKEGIRVSFLHDSTSFLLGAMEAEGTSMDASPCCVMLGTGLGFAFAREGRVCVNESRTPALALWKMPWREGIAEDYISTRTLRALWGGEESVKEIADLAKNGNERAADVFRTVGKNLSELMGEIIPKLGCDRLMLGGQIAKSAELFDLELPVSWSVIQDPELIPLRGAARYMATGQVACEICTGDPLA